MKHLTTITLLNIKLWIALLLLVFTMPVQFFEFGFIGTKNIKKKLEKWFFKIHYQIQDLKKVITNP